MSERRELRQKASASHSPTPTAEGVSNAVEAQGLAGADEIAGRVQLERGHVARLEQSADEQTGELARIAQVGFDALPRWVETSPGATS